MTTSTTSSLLVYSGVRMALVDVAAVLDPTINRTTPTTPLPLNEVLKEVVENQPGWEYAGLPDDRLKQLINSILDFFGGAAALGDVYQALANLTNGCPGAKVLGLDMNYRPGSFAEALAALKRLYHTVYNSAGYGAKDCRRALRHLAPLLDTCYVESKARRLEAALAELRARLCRGGGACPLFAAALCLLASVHARVDVARWFSLLARSAVATSRDRYLPSCPWAGDAAAVLYYLRYNGVTHCPPVQPRTVARVVARLLS